ncbi:hypothetical protein BSKO_01708 [Bryopsis sp. KO-2023]|nr:hypothetical protein BSKO_01708 [Bryopsis sp. KO-2023]
MERREKAEQARRETERILEEQHEEVRLRKLEIERRDKEREQRIRQEKAARAIANQEKRQQADERISRALLKDQEIQLKKLEDFKGRETKSVARRQQMMEMRLKQEQRKREMLKQQEEERKMKYQLALAREEDRKMRIKRKADQKDEELRKMQQARVEENSRRRVHRQLFQSLRLDKVDAMRKMQTYQRQQLFETIMSENQRVGALLHQREDLQHKRKMANMHASMQRQAMNELMDKLKTSKNFDGSLTLDQLTRPNTR